MLATRLHQILEGPILLDGDPVPASETRPERPHAEPPADVAAGNPVSQEASPAPADTGGAPLQRSLPDLTHG
jgi:hypothetical protein